jgi:hypothetical protein
MDTSNNVYVVTTDSTYIYVYSFNAFGTFPITPTYYMAYGSTTYPMQANTVIIDPSFTYLLIGGSI